MRFTIQIHADHVVLTVTAAAPVSPAMRWALRTNDGVFFQQDPRGSRRWDEVENSDSLALTRTLFGPWAAGLAVRWCRRTGEDLGFSLAIHDGIRDYNGKPLDRDNAPHCPVEYDFNGVVSPNFEDMEAAYEQLPDQVFELGAMTVSTPALRVTDPCYEVDTGCASTIDVLPGQWAARVLVGSTNWDTRVKRLQITHESLATTGILELDSLENAGITAGVDSGQCGFFDEAAYPRDKASFEDEDNAFYGRCCALTLDDSLPGGGVLADGTGVVSRSGFGDGGYNVFAQRNAEGDVVALVLLFIGHSEADDQD